MCTSFRVVVQLRHLLNQLFSQIRKCPRSIFETGWLDGDIFSPDVVVSDDPVAPDLDGREQGGQVLVVKDGSVERLVLRGEGLEQDVATLQQDAEHSKCQLEMFHLMTFESRLVQSFSLGERGD